MSLAALGVQISAEELFSALSDAWVEFRGIWDNGRGFARDPQAVAGARLPASANGSRSNTGTMTLEGIFDTIDDTGCLIVRTVDGRRVPVAAGEVFFGSAASVGAA